MATYLARNSLLAVSTDGGTTYNDVERVVDVSIDSSADEEDYTSHDDGADRVSEPGHRDHSASVSIIYDEGQTGQDAMRASFTGQNVYYWRYRPATGSGLQQHVFQGYVTSNPMSSPLDGHITSDVTIKVTGAITLSAQS